MKYAIVILPTILLFVPFIGQAAGLVPCGGPGEEMCNTNFAVSFANGLISYLITLLGVIAVIVLVYSGFKMVLSAGNESEWKAAKERFTNIVIGIVIILAAWLVVDTVLKILTDKGLDQWGDLGVTSDSESGIFPSSMTTATGQYTDAEARAALAAAGIGVNKTEAQGTSLQGINKATIDDAIALKQSCGCQVTITAGTESTGGHASGAISHGTGYKYDMRPSTTLDNYIASNYTRLKDRGDGAAQYQSPSGSIYAREGDHWDVVVR